MVLFPGRHWRTQRVPRVRPNPTPPWGHRIDFELNGPGGGWTDVTADVLLKPAIKISYGLSGSGPVDLMGKLGTASFGMNNAENNSQQKLGLYTPDGVNVRSGFRRGMGVRYRYSVPGVWDEVYTKFVGSLLNPDPTPGVHAERQTNCDAVDWIYQLQQTKLNLPIQVNKRPDQIITTIAGQVTTGTVPIINFDVGDSTFPWSLNNRADQQPSAATEILRSVQSELGRYYLRGSRNTGQMYQRFEKRSARLVPSPIASFIGTLHGLVPSSDIRNKALVKAHPSSVDLVDVVLFAKPNANNPAVQPGQSIKITGRYSDPNNRTSKVSAISTVNLVSGTDYTMFANNDGTGANLTANFTVVATPGANQVDYVITNTGLTLAYVIILQQRGKGLYDYTPSEAVQINAASILINGESPISLDMVYQPDIAIADAVAEYLVDTFSTPGFSGATLRFVPKTYDEMRICMALEPGDPIAVSEDVTGINGTYYIQNVSLTALENNWGIFEWQLQRALVQNYWQLGIAGFSELGMTTVLAPL